MPAHYVAHARYPIWRNLFAPIFVADQLYVVGLLAAFCATFGALTGDPTLLLCVAIVAYVAYVASMQRFLPYSVPITSDDAAIVEAMLDKTPVLLRAEGKWRWKRKSALPRWLTSDLDRISIQEAGAAYSVLGRRDDLKILARTLNKRGVRARS